MPKNTETLSSTWQPPTLLTKRTMKSASSLSPNHLPTNSSLRSLLRKPWKAETRKQRQRLRNLKSFFHAPQCYTPKSKTKCENVRFSAI